MRILFVDDAPDIRVLFSLTFQMEGHETQVAADGVEAVAAVKKEAFDAIVMDVEMPQMNGLDATRHIRKLPYGHDVPIVVFTGYSQLGYDTKAAEAGANAIVYKPLMPQQLLVQLEQLYHA